MMSWRNARSDLPPLWARHVRSPQHGLSGMSVLNPLTIALRIFLPSSQPWQPRLGSSPRSAPSADPIAPAADWASAARYLLSTSNTPSRGNLPG
eukprot:7812159-Pyramimonas_sp.AAC.1